MSNRTGERRARLPRVTDRPKEEAEMATTTRTPLITLGWQVWSILAIILAFVLAAGAYLLHWYPQ